MDNMSILNQFCIIHSRWSSHEYVFIFYVLKQNIVN